MVNGEQAYPAYEATGALHIACPNCGAQVGEYCVTADGIRRVRDRRVPCVARMAAAARGGSASTASSQGSGVAWSPTDCIAARKHNSGADSFSEPRYTRED
ncbi:hypothetical protein [Mycobacterium sp. SMC-17]|uniref:zinc finger domain-containing protein n=1 Tax=Mycobacterium sp. SMC-17 TaxID=3381628 RepID=UPI00387678ED